MLADSGGAYRAEARARPRARALNRETPQRGVPRDAVPRPSAGVGPRHASAAAAHRPTHSPDPAGTALLMLAAAAGVALVLLAAAVFIQAWR